MASSTSGPPSFSSPIRGGDGGVSYRATLLTAYRERASPGSVSSSSPQFKLKPIQVQIPSQVRLNGNDKGLSALPSTLSRTGIVLQKRYGANDGHNVEGHRVKLNGCEPTISEAKRWRNERQALESLKADRWWVHPPTLSGSDASDHQKFLSDPTHFTGVCGAYVAQPQSWYPSPAVQPSSLASSSLPLSGPSSSSSSSSSASPLHSASDVANGGVYGGPFNASGDYCSTPRRAAVMLRNSSYSELTIRDRPADFRNEVIWRMRLRSGGEGAGQYSAADLEEMEKLARRSQEIRISNKKKKNDKANPHTGKRVQRVLDSVGPLMHFFLDAEGERAKQEAETMAKAEEDSEHKRNANIQREQKMRDDLLKMERRQFLLSKIDKSMK